MYNSSIEKTVLVVWKRNVLDIILNISKYKQNTSISNKWLVYLCEYFYPWNMHFFLVIINIIQYHIKIDQNMDQQKFQSMSQAFSGKCSYNVFYGSQTSKKPTSTFFLNLHPYIFFSFCNNPSKTFPISWYTYYDDAWRAFKECGVFLKE